MLVSNVNSVNLPRTGRLIDSLHTYYAKVQPMLYGTRRQKKINRSSDTSIRTIAVRGSASIAGRASSLLAVVNRSTWSSIIAVRGNASIVDVVDVVELHRCSR